MTTYHVAAEVIRYVSGPGYSHRIGRGSSGLYLDMDFEKSTTLEELHRQLTEEAKRICAERNEEFVRVVIVHAHPYNGRPCQWQINGLRLSKQN